MVQRIPISTPTRVTHNTPGPVPVGATMSVTKKQITMALDWLTDLQLEQLEAEKDEEWGTVDRLANQRHGARMVLIFLDIIKTESDD